MSTLMLEGIRILDLSLYWAGPIVTRLLADMGAEVIKIESLRHIDPWRGPVLFDTKFAAVRGSYPAGMIPERPYNCAGGFNLQNRNKYGITLSLDTPQGKEVFKKLVKISDVVCENYSTRVMAKFDLDYPVLKELNPQIIMVSLPALGRTGPDKDYVAVGPTIDCMSGMACLTGYIGEEPMIESGLPYSDPLGSNAAFATMVALHYRRRSGKGTHIDYSQVEGVIAFQADAVMDYTMNGRIRGRMGNRHTSMAPHGCYRCKGEDNWVVIAIPSDAAWLRFCQVVGQPSWAKDAKFSDVLTRYQHQNELDKLIEAWTIKYDHYEVMRILQQADIPAGPALDAKELAEEPHLNERGFYEVVTHPEAGTHPYIGRFAEFSETPISIRMPAPCLGQHNQYVFGELLEMSQEEMVQLEEEGVIGTTPPVKQGGSRID